MSMVKELLYTLAKLRGEAKSPEELQWSIVSCLAKKRKPKIITGRTARYSYPETNIKRDESQRLQGA